MRFVLATALSLLLVAPAFAWQQSQTGSQMGQPHTGTQYQSGIPSGNQPSGQQMNSQAGIGQGGNLGQSQTGNQAGQVLLLVPANETSTFKQAIPASLSQDVKIEGSQPFMFNGQQYRVVAIPARDLKQVDQAINGTSLPNDVKVVLGFGEFVNVADLSTIADRLNQQAPGSAIQSNGQTNAPMSGQNQ